MIIRRNVLVYHAEESRKTVDQARSTAHFSEAGGSDKSGHGVARDLLGALPFAWAKYQPPATSLFAE